MCDTFYFYNNKNKFFMKNSDRGPNEPNLLQFIKGGIHTEKSVECTYISIPQVKETYSIMLVSPSWLYGAEMGINEFNVSIGNEAVFTKNKNNKKESLIGMDYLRLALERSKSAGEAVDVILNLLNIYSQGGNCGYDHKFYYDNSYLIMDKNETYILETVGKDYALYKAVTSYNISNKLSIEKEFIKASRNYNNFRKENSDFIFTFGSKSKDRECCGRKLLNDNQANMLNAINILSSHRTKNATKKGDVGSICMHKTSLGDHTTSSMIVDYNYDNPTIWLTGSPSPCISIFKPYYFGTKSSLIKDSKEDSLNYYYKRMYLNRAVLSGLVNYNDFKEKVDKINNDFITEDKSLRDNNASIDELVKFQEKCYRVEDDFINSYNDLIESIKSGKTKLKGIFNKLTKNLSNNPFSSSLTERLK